MVPHSSLPCPCLSGLLAAVILYRNSIKQAYIGSKKVTVIFETTRPVVKFTALGIACSASPVTLTFVATT